jgi:uncharacterized protein YbjT (DUF2867 family)
MIFVTGTTGNIGGAVLAALAAQGTPTRGLVRDPAAASLPVDTQPVVGDLNDPDSFAAALTGVDGLFLLAGYDRAGELLARARDAGVRRVVLLSSSSVEGTRTDNPIAEYNIAAEEAVRESALDWTVLRPNAFMSNALRWLPQLQEGDTVRVQFPDVALSSVDPRDIADVAVLALTGGSRAGAVHRLTGPEAHTPDQRLAILGEALGRPLRAEPMSLTETRAELGPYADTFVQFYVDGIIDETTVTTAVADLTGHPARSFAEWCSEHADAFT